MHGVDSWKLELLLFILLAVHYWWVTLPTLALLCYGGWRVFRSVRPKRPRMTDYEWKRLMDSRASACLRANDPPEKRDE